MTRSLSVSEAEQGVARLFRLDMAPEDISHLQDPSQGAPSTGAAVAQLLGLDWLDADFVEIFAVSDLDELGLAGYLIQGNGVSKQDIALDRSRLEAVTGHVLIVYSSAFQGKSAQLAPTRQLVFLGSYREDRPEIAFAALPSEAAKGVLTGAPDDAAPIRSPNLSLMLALLALPTVALILGVIVYGALK